MNWSRITGYDDVSYMMVHYQEDVRKIIMMLGVTAPRSWMANLLARTSLRHYQPNLDPSKPRLKLLRREGLSMVMLPLNWQNGRLEKFACVDVLGYCLGTPYVKVQYAQTTHHVKCFDSIADYIKAVYENNKFATDIFISSAAMVEQPTAQLRVLAVNHHTVFALPGPSVASRATDLNHAFDTTDDLDDDFKQEDELSEKCHTIVNQGFFSNPIINGFYVVKDQRAYQEIKQKQKEEADDDDDDDDDGFEQISSPPPKPSPVKPIPISSIDIKKREKQPIVTQKEQALVTPCELCKSLARWWRGTKDKV
jgi:hypothetical protein